uniref:THAP-type domain-containing protein n=1 Tax=Lepeophtheirus salmonis TaxID=72036 RepID=A0A0K2T1K7_LEPSM
MQSLFSFPMDKSILMKWILRMKRVNWKPSTHSRLCSKHIERNQFQRLDHSKRIRKPCFGAIPTLFSHVKPIVQRETRNSRKSNEEGEELGNMKLCSHDHT